jgi:hypothetical protein
MTRPTDRPAGNLDKCDLYIIAYTLSLSNRRDVRSQQWMERTGPVGKCSEVEQLNQHLGFPVPTYEGRPMRLARVQFTIGQFMILISVVSLLLGFAEWARRSPNVIILVA